MIQAAQAEVAVAGIAEDDENDDIDELLNSLLRKPEAVEAVKEAEIAEIVKDENDDIDELLNSLLRKPEAVEAAKVPATEAPREAVEAAKEAATEAVETEDRNTGNPIALAKQGTPYPATDSGNGERLAYWSGDRIRWDVARDCWRIWDGRRWAADTELKVLDMALQAVRKIKREAAECPTKQGVKGVADTLWAWAAQSESEARLKACIERAKTVPGIAVGAGEWDCDPCLLNVRNGTIDLQTGNLKKHDKADKITKLADVDFDPTAHDEKWEKFLLDSTGGDGEFVEFLKRSAGYTLTGLTTEERCFFVYGVAASGKTTFLESLKSAMGEYAATINPDMLCKSKFGGGGGAATPELARLDGVRLAAGSEIEQGRELAEATIKSITGGETITARHLYAGLFEFQPKFALWLAMNHCPKASADDGAIWRRVLRVNFDFAVSPEKRDKTLKTYLQNQGASAVLAWAVKGCLAWQKDGLKVPECVQKSTDAYRAESDPLTNFFEDCVKVDSRAWTSAADVAKEYADYCADNGIKYPVSHQTLAKKLKAFGARADRRGSVRGWAGVRVSIDGFDAVDKPEAVEFLKPNKMAS